MCLLANSGVQHILGCVFFVFFPSCVPYIGRFSRFPFLISPSVFSNLYLPTKCTNNTVDVKLK